MAATLIIAYEKGAEINFDYYLNKHMPVAWGAWKSHAKSYRVSTPDPNSPSPYEVIATVEWDSMEMFGKGMAETPAETMEWLKNDLSNYSKKPPVMWTQEVKGSS